MAIVLGLSDIIYDVIIDTVNTEETFEAGRDIGRSLVGGDIVELVGDVGAGKTTLTKGIAVGLGVDEPVQSPSFTISQNYQARDGLRLVHYDFYRLPDAGIMSEELKETINDPRAVVVVEWADTVADILPKARKKVVISTTSEEGRRLEIL